MPEGIHSTDSETGKNASVSGGLLHCWRHNVYHNAFSYIAVLSGVTSCECAGAQHGESESFGVSNQDGETVFKVWSYAKQKRLIPENDPIPYCALVYYAISKGLCKEEWLYENGKLPNVCFQLVLTAAKHDGLNLGRGRENKTKAAELAA